MRKRLCPQCKIGAFYVKNALGERLPVYITLDGKVIPKEEGAATEGFYLDEVFCLGCSWHGSPHRLVRY